MPTRQLPETTLALRLLKTMTYRAAAKKAGISLSTLVRAVRRQKLKEQLEGKQ